MVSYNGKLSREKTFANFMHDFVAICKSFLLWKFFTIRYLELTNSCNGQNYCSTMTAISSGCLHLASHNEFCVVSSTINTHIHSLHTHTPMYNLLLWQSIFLIKKKHSWTVHHHIVTDGASNNNPVENCRHKYPTRVTGLIEQVEPLPFTTITGEKIANIT